MFVGYREQGKFLVFRHPTSTSPTQANRVTTTRKCFQHPPSPPRENTPIQSSSNQGVQWRVYAFECCCCVTTVGCWWQRECVATCAGSCALFVQWGRGVFAGRKFWMAGHGCVILQTLQRHGRRRRCFVPVFWLGAPSTVGF